MAGYGETGVGVRASSGSGLALEAVGPVKFSSAGRFSLPAGHRSLVINPGVPLDKGSVILATLDYGGVHNQAPRYITHTETFSSTEFRVHLNAPANFGVAVSWFVIQAGAKSPT